MLRGPKGRLWAACICVGLSGFVGVVTWVNSSVSQTAPPLSIDIRATVALSASTKEWSFVATVADCSEIAGARSNHPDPEQAILVRRELVGGGCEFSMKLPEPERLNPSVVISFSDGSQALGYTEAFALERVAPTISFAAIVFSGNGDKMTVSASAADDTDVSVVALEATGLHVSDLRLAGGVVDVAAKSAFVDTPVPMQVHPDFDGQATFEATLDIESPLTAAEVARDILVLVEGSVRDASGNVASFSKIVFPSESVAEVAHGLRVQPTAILLTDLLQSQSITAFVDFEFRGEIPLSGAGNGVVYTSSNPDLVEVTPAGVVIPRASTDGQSVAIQVQYGALVTTVPVTVDESRTLVAIEPMELQPGESFELPRLNRYASVPALQGRFDDGQVFELGGQFPVVFTIPESASGILEIDSRAGFIARAAISETSPVITTGCMTHGLRLCLDVPVTAIDAPPSITLSLPKLVSVGEPLTIRPRVDDDVAIAEVHFYLDESPVGVVRNAPFSLELDLNEELAGRTFSLRAEAVDTIGQLTASDAVEVRAQPRGEAWKPPDFEMELPLPMARVVEGLSTTFQISLAAGTRKDPVPTHVSRVDFYVEGELVGTAGFPVLEASQHKPPMPSWPTRSRLGFSAAESRTLAGRLAGGGG